MYKYMIQRISYCSFAIIKSLHQAMLWRLFQKGLYTVNLWQANCNTNTDKQL